QLITDVVNEYKDCTGKNSTPAPQPPTVKDGVTHKVQKGDTLWGISQKYSTTVDRLKSLNPEIDVLALQVGDVVMVKPKESGTTSQKPKTHTVVSGNTLSYLAKKYGTTVARLEQLNPGVSPTALRIGSKLVVGYESGQASKPSNTAPTDKVDPRLAEYLKHKPIRPYPNKVIKF